MKPAGRFEIYFDFDGTITEIDILDDIVARFSIDQKWKLAEASWAAGEIGSRECLERQLAGVRISQPVLEDYLTSVRIDPAFGRLVEFIRGRGIEPIVVSDSFVRIIEPVLARHGILGVKVFANELCLEGDRALATFPYFQSICSTAGNCKCSHLFRRQRPAGTRKIFVGDGRSDICPAGICEILFAKNSLLRHYAGIRKDCIAFERLDTVFSHLRHLLA